MKRELTKEDIIWIASKYAEKDYGYEQLHYGDDLYGNEDKTDEVWEYVDEYNDIGRIAFREKYKEYKLY
jgi:hypothetical protein